MGVLRRLIGIEQGHGDQDAPVEGHPPAALIDDLEPLQSRYASAEAAIDEAVQRLKAASGQVDGRQAGTFDRRRDAHGALPPGGDRRSGGDRRQGAAAFGRRDRAAE
jgi:hypothetical protein